MNPISLQKARKEVETLKDKLGKRIEPAIKDLVIGLRRWGVKTEQSCEGHKDGSRLSYPWVSVPMSQAKKVAKLISWQNRPKLPDGRKNKNFWIIRPGCDLRLMPENKNRPLKEKRLDAIKFGIFLQNLPNDWGKK